jgi:hypothetical protein
VGYNPKSCSPLEKSFYKPIEIAIRWCELIEHETTILATIGDDTIPRINAFPQWPCLRANTEKIIDAIKYGDLIYGRDGTQVLKGEQVAAHRLTIRHSDLKSWMITNYPDQKPAFLFDEIERDTHSAISAESYRTLKASHDANEIKLKYLYRRIQEIEAAKREVELERDQLRSMIENFTEKMKSEDIPSGRAETTYQNTIAALLEFIGGDIPGIEKHPSFESEAKLIEFIDEYYRGYGGLSKSNLARKFPECKRKLHNQ